MQSSLVDRLTSSYVQSLLYLAVAFVYSILAGIVLVIGILLFFGSFNPQTLTINGFLAYLGLIISLLGYILFFVGFFAAFLFAATRGFSAKQELGFVEAYKETFQLIIELAVVIVFSFVLFLLGGLIGGFIAGLLFFIGGVLIALFPLAAMFYTVNYLMTL